MFPTLFFSAFSDTILIEKGLSFEQTLCHKIFSKIFHAEYPSLAFVTSNFVTELVRLDPAKRGLKSGTWIDGYGYQNKEKNLNTVMKNTVKHVLTL